MRCGLCTGPVAFVWLPPERQKYSQCVLPTISPPSSRIRVTTVASNSGMYPSSVEAPFIIGTPATMTLSLMATRLPFSLPLGAPLMDVLRYHAFPVLLGPRPVPRRSRILHHRHLVRHRIAVLVRRHVPREDLATGL